MNGARELLSAALDSGGWICIFVQKGERQWNKFFQPGDYDAATAYAAKMDEGGFNCYFCTATLKSEGKRTAANAHAIKAIKLDLDVDPQKPRNFASREEAALGLRAFCKKVGLPRPTIASSGGGFHVYWILNDALEPASMQPILDAMKALCVHHEFKADPTTTSDLVRVLRVPGTHNQKDPKNPREVELLTPVVSYDTDTIADLLESAAAKIPNAVPAQLFAGTDITHLQQPADATTKALAGEDREFHYLFSKMLRRSTDGAGCAQVKRLWNGRATAGENDWRDLVGLAKFGDDGDEAIHLASKDHDEYSPSETIKKAALIPKPFTCEHFRTDIHGDLCTGCVHKGKLKTPITLGVFTPRATEQDNIILARNENVDDAPRLYHIPDFPKGYYRGKYGGVFKESNVDDKPDTPICYKDIYAVTNLKEQDERFLIEMCVNNGMDGVQQFVLHMSDLYSDVFTKELCGRGITPPLAKMGYEALRQYVIDFHEHLRKKKSAVPVKHQFGWTEEFKTFVIGEREIVLHDDGTITTEYSQPSPELVPYMTSKFKKSGSLEEWCKTANAYNSDVRMAPHRFGVLLGFAAPLMPFLGESGVVVNLFAQDSGHGKSTVLRTQATMWGAPSGMLNYTDTENGRYHVMGVYKNLPVTVDEMTNVPADRFKAFLFNTSQGRGKQRMTSQANALRINNTSWETIVTVSSNTCYAELLRVEKSGNEGEYMRLIEVEFSEAQRHLVDKKKADRLFGGLKDNYGHAGEAFIKHIMTKGVGVVRAMLDKAQHEFDESVKMEGKERFWSCTFACAYVGGVLAKEAGLLDFDMEAELDGMRGMVGELRVSQKAGTDGEEKDRVVMDYLSANYNKMVRVTAVRGSPLPMVDIPNNEIVGRVNTAEDGRIEAWFSCSKFDAFLAERNVHRKGFMEFMEKSGNPIVRSNQRLLILKTDGLREDARKHTMAQQVYKVTIRQGGLKDDDTEGGTDR